MILDEILTAKRREVERLRPEGHRLAELAERAPPPRGFAAALAAGESVAVIAEFKRRSPSAGAIDAYANAGSVTAGYAEGGASAISVLTDGPYFGGALRDLAAARASSGLPVLRKDFVIDPVQLVEARAAGADAVLLIARALEGGLLEELLDGATELGMAALVETHDEAELDRALDAGAGLVGVNARDLATFEVDIPAALEVLSTIPGEVLAVAESGIRGAADIEAAGQAGADAVLVGGWLMRGDPAAGVAELVGQRRRPRARAGAPALADD